MSKWRVLVTENFQDDLIQILQFISRDKPQASKKFRKEVLTKIESLHTMPFRNRQSIYFERENIRDIVHKGYVITYQIEKKVIKVFSILKHKYRP
ncbi:MAG: type II toxin-antitoxin system RelE/ParE family toxin [Cyclobacteriaceae bacterium]